MLRQSVYLIVENVNTRDNANNCWQESIKTGFLSTWSLVIIMEKLNDWSMIVTRGCSLIDTKSPMI